MPNSGSLGIPNSRRASGGVSNLVPAILQPVADDSRVSTSCTALSLASRARANSCHLIARYATRGRRLLSFSLDRDFLSDPDARAGVDLWVCESGVARVRDGLYGPGTTEARGDVQACPRVKR
jgi:hypothetical protein